MSYYYGDRTGNTFCGSSQFYLLNVTDNTTLSDNNTILTYKNGVIEINSMEEGTWNMYFYWQLTEWPDVFSKNTYLTVIMVHPCKNSTFSKI